MKNSPRILWYGLALAGGISLLHGAAAHAQTPPPPPPPAQGELALMLFDLSGSMLEPAKQGGRKIDLAISRANQFLDEVRNNREYAMWTFTGDRATPIFKFEQHATKDQLRSAIAHLADKINGMTPFAGSFCDAVDYLIETQDVRDHNVPPGSTPILYEKRIALYTDGLENNTPASHACWGHRSTAAQPWTEADSWQWHIYNKASTGNANTPPAPSLPATVIADVTMLDDQYIEGAFRLALAPDAAGAATKIGAPTKVGGISAIAAKKPVITADIIGDLRRPPGMPVVGGTVVMSPGAVVKSETLLAIQAYSGVSKRTGGEFRAISRLKDVPVTGDANGDGCVDTRDHDEVMKHYGKNVGYNAAADLNRDRTVNYSDYLTLLQNWNDGC